MELNLRYADFHSTIHGMPIIREYPQLRKLV